MQENFYDLIIIGGGPAGLSASIYAKRALIKILLIEKSSEFGGKLNKTEKVDNYIGFRSINGEKLAQKMIKHVNDYKIEKRFSEISLLKKNKDFFFLKTKAGEEFFSKSIIVSSGTIEKKLGVEREDEFENLGISYCAICDGFLFKNRVVAVIGGGYSALETSLYMSNIAKKVYLIHRRESFNVDDEILKKIKSNKKIEIILNFSIKNIIGDKKIEKIVLENYLNNEKKELFIDCLFPCIGLLPLVDFIDEDLKIILDEQNYIKINDDCSTIIEGLFAAGDVCRISNKKIKQIATSVSEGATSAQSAVKYLNKKSIY